MQTTNMLYIINRAGLAIGHAGQLAGGSNLNVALGQTLYGDHPRLRNSFCIALLPKQKDRSTTRRSLSVLMSLN